MLLQAEFLAIALVLVYVGAVMVLFLFRGDDARHQSRSPA
jgi:NADH:ubiquinone oxidoreductase subunit 6 (subunit J)